MHVTVGCSRTPSAIRATPQAGSRNDAGKQGRNHHETPQYYGGRRPWRLVCLRRRRRPPRRPLGGRAARVTAPDDSPMSPLQCGNLRRPAGRCQPLAARRSLSFRGRGSGKAPRGRTLLQLASATRPALLLHEYYWDPSSPETARTVSYVNSGRRRSRPPVRCRSWSTTTAAATARQHFPKVEFTFSSFAAKGFSSFGALPLNIMGYLALDPSGMRSAPATSAISTPWKC